VVGTTDLKGLATTDEVYSHTVAKLNRLNLPTAYVEEAMEENYVRMTDESVSSTWFLNYSLPNWTDLPVIELSRTAPALEHEAVHDYLFRNIHESPVVRDVFKQEALRFIGSKMGSGRTVTREDAKLLTTEAFAHFVEGQINARDYLSERADLPSVLQDYEKGDLNREEFLAIWGQQRQLVNNYLHAKGTHPAIGTLTMELSDAAKSWAASTFLDGTYFNAFEDLPGVKLVLSQMDPVLRAEVEGAR
jgi:hypothetical protein